MFFPEMKWGNFIEKLGRSAARRVGSLCRSRLIFLDRIGLVAFLRLPIVCALNCVARFNLVFVPSIYGFVTESKE